MAYYSNRITAASVKSKSTVNRVPLIYDVERLANRGHCTSSAAVRSGAHPIKAGATTSVAGSNRHRAVAPSSLTLATR